MTASINQQFATAGNVKYYTHIIDFALHLSTLTGHQFLSFEAEYDLEKKLLVNRRGSGRGANGIPVPYRGKHLRKLSSTQATVNFNYDVKLENRGGERPESEGNWIQAVIINDKMTPLATHKGDIKTRLKDGVDPKSDAAKNLANHVAVFDKNGSVEFTSDSPRLYLRYEIIRQGKQEDRNERSMLSESVYVLEGDEPISEKELEDCLPARLPRTDQTDFQLTSLENIVSISCGGSVWRRRDYQYPARVSASNMKEVIEKLKAMLPKKTETETDTAVTVNQQPVTAEVVTKAPEEATAKERQK